MTNLDTVGLHEFMQRRKDAVLLLGSADGRVVNYDISIRLGINSLRTKPRKLLLIGFGVFIEQAQNIIRYSSQKTRAAGDSIGTIAISYIDDTFLIEAVNQISSTQKSALEKTLLELSLKDQKGSA